MRHAETETKQSGQSDFERELLPKGVRQATSMGLRLAAQEDKPDLVICSSAHRARHTGSLVASALSFTVDSIQFEETIYSADIGDLLEILREVDNQFQRVLLIGHNPTMSSMINYLAKDFKQSLSTCDLAWVELDITDWASIDQHCGKMKSFIPSSSLLG